MFRVWGFRSLGVKGIEKQRGKNFNKKHRASEDLLTDWGSGFKTCFKLYGF